MTVFKNTILWCEDTRITTIIFCCSSFADSRSLFLLPVRSWCLKTPLLLCEISPVASWFPFLVLFTRYKTFGFCSELLTYSKHVYLFFFFFMLATLWSRKPESFYPPFTDKNLSHREVKQWVGGGGISPAAHAASSSWVKSHGPTSSPGTNTGQAVQCCLTCLCDCVLHGVDRGLQEKYWVREGLFISCCVFWTSFHNDITSSHELFSSWLGEQFT